MITSYELLKLFHLAAVVLFLGNVTLGLWWVKHAERTRDAKLIGHAMHGVVRSDRWFTIPGVFLIIGAGLGAAVTGHLKVMGTPWIFYAVILFFASGAVFGAVLGPLQKQIVAVANASNVDQAQLASMLRRWHAWGWVSTAPLWVAFAMMILKWPA